MENQSNSVPYELSTPVFDALVDDADLCARYQKLYRKADKYLKQSSKLKLKNIRAQQDKDLLCFLQGWEESFDGKVNNEVQQMKKGFDSIADKPSASPRFLIERATEFALRKTKRVFQKEFKGRLEQHYGQARSFVDFSIDLRSEQNQITNNREL